MKAIDLYNTCKSYNKTATTLQMYRQTITNWIKLYKNNLHKFVKRIEFFIKKNYSFCTKHNLKQDNDLLINFIKNTIYTFPFYTKKQMI